MLPISKLPEPSGLRNYKKDNPESDDYDHFTSFSDHFKQLRENLLKEQKYVCAYCGQTLEEDVLLMKTEHYNPQTTKVKLEPKDSYNNLNYHNLLACCRGNDRKKGENHCDSKKGPKKLQHILNPAILQNRNVTIRYKVNFYSEEVLILSTDPDVDRELNQILNLNHQVLRTNRFNRWKRATRHLGEVKTWKEVKVKQLIEDYQSLIEGRKHQEFKDFILWHLNDWIRRFG